MADHARRQVGMIGLPKSGKTTFLAALWHTLKERGTGGAIRLRAVGDDRTYLNSVETAWAECTEIGRTPQVENSVVLHLEDSHGHFQLRVPDISGETFVQQLTERRWTESFDRSIRDLDGLLLFVHPDVDSGHRLSLAHRLSTAIGGEGSTDSEPVASVEPWREEFVPTQVQLIEILQFIRHRRSTPLRLIVVISAWDLMLSVELTPPDALARLTPMLHQFLSTNRDRFVSAVVGISAQGGDLGRERSRLLGLSSPQERIIVSGEGMNGDITAPIAWLLRA